MTDQVAQQARKEHSVPRDSQSQKQEAKKRGNPGPKHLRKASQEIKLAEAAFARNDGHLEDKVIKLRSALNICLPGFEKQLRSSKGLDEPGIRDIFLEFKFRV